MCYYIGIEDLAANALIEVLKVEKTRRFLTYEEIEKYGSQVVKVLDEKGEKAILILSRDSTNAMFRNYSEFFEEKEEEGKLGIKLKDDIEVNHLIRKFRGYLALDVLLAFINESCVGVLGV